ncbi:DUF3137 domain-containing protein [Eubacterium sp.]|uniref:DUF3137 domain-containing protein n=1 Tax=Eubacterium sp. TaxID=142586 RepID=UPI003F05159B
MERKKLDNIVINDEAKNSFAKMLESRAIQKKIKIIETVVIIALIIISLLCISFTKGISIIVGIVAIIVAIVVIGEKEDKQLEEAADALQGFIESSLSDYVETPSFSDGSDFLDTAMMLSPSMNLSGTFIDVGNLLKGKYDGYEFTTLDIHCYDLNLDKRKSKEQKKNYYKKGLVYAEGIYTRTKFNKSIDNTVVIAPLHYDMQICKDDLKEIKLDNPEFEKRFTVYSDDQVAAFSIVDAVFMESLLALDFNKQPSIIIIEDDQVIIGMPFRQKHKNSPVLPEEADKLEEKSFVDLLSKSNNEADAKLYLESEMSTLKLLYDTLNIGNRIYL